jgi:hypothetical protein
MVAQRQELATREFSFTPTTLEEAQKYAAIIANSGICPEGFRGRPNDVLIVLQLGSELGLKPMQALRSLGSINGMPFAYGDGLLALVKRHSQFEDMKEWFEGDLNTATLTAFCTMSRKGKEPVTQKFSVEDAKRAGLWGKAGVWQKYPRRMLQHRARGYAARDAFPDALYGLMSEEEALSVAQPEAIVVPLKTTGKGMAGLEESLGIKEPETVTVIEGELISEGVEPTELEAEPSKLGVLMELIDRLKVTKASITVTLKKFGVATLEELSDEQIDKWTNHLKIKEQKNDRS